MNIFLKENMIINNDGICYSMNYCYIIILHPGANTIDITEKSTETQHSFFN
jgi:hypothetical protein